MSAQIHKNNVPVNNVHTAKLAVMAEVGYCQKTKVAGLNYSFAGEAAIINALRPVMIEHDLALSTLRSEILESTSYETRNGGTMRLVRTRQTFRLTHAPSGTFEDIEVLGEGADAGDKAIPKALTGAFKYALRQAFIIETGDDPDLHASVEGKTNGHTTPMRNDQGGVRQKVTQEDVDRITAKARMDKHAAEIFSGELTDEDAMPFGKHKGKNLGDVETEYLKWWMEQPDSKTKRPDLWRYAAGRVLGSGSQEEADIPPPIEWGDV